MTKKIILLLLLTVSLRGFAHEGMWIPSLIKSMVEDDMKAMGMKISAEDLYAINKSSIKDAVVHFNGGCTSVLVSEEGLLLTNHHCGYSLIQSHSTLENNYLEDGFWAMSKAEELPNPGISATIIKEIRDITEDVFKDLPTDATEAEREAHIKKVIANSIAKAKESTGYDAYAKPFFYGNQYLLFIIEKFEDVRLVGAPPSSIGKFGYDTDNWVWPRHTGDFSVFRIYANQDNKPAEYSQDNVPYKPVYSVPVNIGGVEENDFTIVYGFPGRTENYITKEAVRQNLEVINPQRLKMRSASLGVIDAAMAKDPMTKIQYAAKQSRISNAYKKWIGQSKGLIRLDAIQKKDSVESRFTAQMILEEVRMKKYGTILPELNKVEEQMLSANVGRNYLIEFYYYGPEVIRFSSNFKELVELSKNKEVADSTIANKVEELKGKLGFFKNYDAKVDKAIMNAQIDYVLKDLDEYLNVSLPAFNNQAASEFVDELYEKSLFVDKKKLSDFLDGYKRNSYKKIENDPAIILSGQFLEMYTEKVRPELLTLGAKEDSLMRLWMQAQMEVLPERTYFADANGTLRITFGKVEGYKPFDGADYAHYTTLAGIMEKEDPDNAEFVVPAKLKELYTDKDYGSYVDKSGEMHVAFIASNHTSGGNSGSPVFDANGALIGLNFDRTWESTMSDIMFNPNICRNITVDIRYVLFIMDKFAGAKHLVDEMKLVKD